MTPPQVERELDSTVEKLTRRYDLFQLMRKSHLRWMNRTDDPQIKEIHRTLAALFKSIMK